MGIVKVTVTLRSSLGGKRAEKVDLLVDTGAVYSIVPGEILERLGIEAAERRRFRMADGRRVNRKVGGAWFECDGRRGATPVIFGKRNDANILGATALEALGLTIDPTKKTLKPSELILF